MTQDISATAMPQEADHSRSQMKTRCLAKTHTLNVLSFIANHLRHLGLGTTSVLSPLRLVEPFTPKPTLYSTLRDNFPRDGRSQLHQFWC